jgi:ribose transport system substrate-binding protein
MINEGEIPFKILWEVSEVRKYLVLVALLVGLSVFSLALTVGFCVSTLNNPFFVSFTNGAKAEAQTLGIELIVLNAQNSNNTQYNQVEDLIQRKVDAIILNPTDADALVPAVKDANKAGIPVITLDRSVNGGKVAMFIASDNVAGGRMAADYIVKALNGKGKVVLLRGIPGASATRERTKGFMDVISKHPGIEIVADQTANFDMAQGLSVTESILVAHPDIDAIFAENDSMALGAIRAIKSAGRKGIIVVGFDGIPQGVKAVKDGDEALDVAQQPYKMGALGVSAAYFVTQGLSFEPAHLAMPLFPLTKNNVAQWTAASH